MNKKTALLICIPVLLVIIQFILMLENNSKDFNDPPYVISMYFKGVEKNDMGIVKEFEEKALVHYSNDFVGLKFSAPSTIDNGRDYERDWVFDTTNGLSLVTVRQSKADNVFPFVEQKETIIYDFISPSPNFVNYIKQGKIIEGAIYSIKK